MLLRMIYGMKQATVAFWKQCILAFASMNYCQSKADPCLYFIWTKYELVIWISWVDDCLVAGMKTGVFIAKNQMMDRFNCDEIGPPRNEVQRSYENPWTNPTGSRESTPNMKGSRNTKCSSLYHAQTSQKIAKY